MTAAFAKEGADVSPRRKYDRWYCGRKRKLFSGDSALLWRERVGVGNSSRGGFMGWGWGCVWVCRMNGSDGAK
ncbi:hypothetical protein SK128_020645, partial [Halocaridina rubra]